MADPGPRRLQRRRQGGRPLAPPGDGRALRLDAERDGDDRGLLPRPRRASRTRAGRSGASMDFNKDGKPDILWHHQETGELYVWFLNGTCRRSPGAYLTPRAASRTRSGRSAGTLDPNKDGEPDLLWHHQGTGDLYVWFLKGTTAVSGIYLTPSRFTDTRWQIRPGVRLRTRTASRDLLWHHQASGQLYVWYLNGATAATGGAYLNPPASPTPLSSRAGRKGSGLDSCPGSSPARFDLTPRTYPPPPAVDFVREERSRRPPPRRLGRGRAARPSPTSSRWPSGTAAARRARRCSRPTRGPRRRPGAATSSRSRPSASTPSAAGSTGRAASRPRASTASTRSTCSSPSPRRRG